MENIEKQKEIHVTPFEKAVISWEAPEFIQHEKGWKWFVAAGIACLGLMVYSILVSNWTLVVALTVLSAVYVWQHFLVPHHVKVIISNVGMKIGEKEYPYQNIKSFWIIYRSHHVTTLNLRSSSRLLPDVSIDLNGQDPTEIREYLCSQIHEEEGKEESFTDSFIRITKL
ncbi:hypothetical protein ACFL3C_03430 [Patescibacteria group bacterium]